MDPVFFFFLNTLQWKISKLHSTENGTVQPQVAFEGFACDCLLGPGEQGTLRSGGAGRVGGAVLQRWCRVAGSEPLREVEPGPACRVGVHGGTVAVWEVPLVRWPLVCDGNIPRRT